MGTRIVSVGARTSGAAKSAGAGLRVEWGIAESPFGLCTVGWCDRGICHLAFCDRRDGFPDGLRVAWPEAHFSRNDAAAGKLVRKIFSGDAGRRAGVFVRGTAFQIKVWRALLRIPRGGVASYSEIAAAIGNPRACRPVGGACGANPVAWLIPCHRVVHASGTTSGYRWGAERKRSMLAAESGVSRAEKKRCRRDAPAPL